MICIVVHHSASGWTAARSLHSLFDPRLIALPDVARYLPNFELIVDDLSHASAAQILGRAAAPREQPAALILLGLRFGRSALEFFRGERAVLQKLLTLKFGPLPDSVLAKLDAATAPELERWAERVLTATTLDAVLGD